MPICSRTVLIGCMESFVLMSTPSTPCLLVNTFQPNAKQFALGTQPLGQQSRPPEDSQQLAIARPPEDSQKLGLVGS